MAPPSGFQTATSITPPATPWRQIMARQKPSVNASRPAPWCGEPLRLSVTGFTMERRYGLSHDQPDLWSRRPADPTSGKRFCTAIGADKTFLVHAVEASGVTAGRFLCRQVADESKLRWSRPRETPDGGAGAQPAQSEGALQDENALPSWDPR